MWRNLNRGRAWRAGACRGRASRAGACLVVASSLGLAACGGGSSSGATGVRHTMHQFVDDLLNGNYAGACGLLTTSARAAVGGAGCVQRLSFAMSLSSSQVKATIRRQVRRLDHWPVSVHGSTATVHNVNGSTTHFVQRNGRWLIAGGGFGAG